MTGTVSQRASHPSQASVRLAIANYDGMTVGG